MKEGPGDAYGTKILLRLENGDGERMTIELEDELSVCLARSWRVVAGVAGGLVIRAIPIVVVWGMLSIRGSELASITIVYVLVN